MFSLLPPISTEMINCKAQASSSRGHCATPVTPRHYK
jgi:hypothetical protein